MKTLPSAQFKTQYPHLTEPVIVTVNGHAIGSWTPAAWLFRPPEDLAETYPDLAPSPEPAARIETPRERQKRIDEVLRKANG